MKLRLVCAVVATTALSTSVLADGYNWTGIYGGISGGVSGSNSNAKADYDANGSEDNSGWTSGMFSTDAVTSDFYNVNRQADWQSSGTYDHDSGTTAATGSLGAAGTHNPVTPWLTILENDDLNGAGSVRLGANYQVGMFVFGAEADGTLLLNELVVDRDISESASLSVTNTGTAWDSDGAANTQYGYTCTATASEDDDCTYASSYTASYTQTGDFEYRSSIDHLVTVRGRAGFAAGPALFFATGGLAVGKINMSTSAHTSEQSNSNWSGTATDSNIGSGTNTFVTDEGSSTVSQNTSWSESNSKTAYGYAVGGGVSLAMTDSLIWTTDGFYYDLGRHSITAVSNVNDASYTISKRFDGYVVRTGMEWKF